MACEGENTTFKVEEEVEATEAALKELSLKTEESSIFVKETDGDGDHAKTDCAEDTSITVEELAKALEQETVWLKQGQVEAAEAVFITSSLEGNTSVSSEVSEKPLQPLEQETVWLKQQQYEEAETLYQMALAGTKKCTREPGTPSKRLHKQDENRDAKKLRPGETEASETLQSEMAQLSVMANSLQNRLEEFEKTQQRKAQAVKDTTARLTAAVEACQSRLHEELVQGGAQLNTFRSVLGEVESNISKITSTLEENKWSQTSTQESFSNSLLPSVSKMRLELTQLMDSCVCFHAEVPKSDINNIVGEIRKISLLKKNKGVLQFSNVKKDIDVNLRGIKKVVGTSSSNRRSQANKNSSPEDNAQDKPRAGRGQEMKSKKTRHNGSHALSNRNNSSDAKTGTFTFGRQGTQERVSFSNSRSDVTQDKSATPKKRNAYGVESTAQKKQNLFKFKGISPTSKVPFTHQRGLLGPRPNEQPIVNQQATFPFSPFASQPQPLLQNFRGRRSMGAMAPGSGFGNMNFNFANSSPSSAASNFGNGGFLQSCTSTPSNFGASPSAMNEHQAMNTSQQVRQFQQKQAGKRRQGVHSRQSNFSFPFQQNQYRSGFTPHDQMMNSGSGVVAQACVEQQLNQMAREIQHMQQTASHDFQLQKLMQETERLKQIVAQKQHQQQDQFQQQFQLLINAFLQQQAQGPQSKVARAGQFQDSQRQQQRYNHSRQQQWLQQKKNKQQHNKVQQIKHEEQQQGSQTIKKENNAQNCSPEAKSEETGKKGRKESTPPIKILPSKNSKMVRIAQLKAQTQSDKYKAGISSMMAIEEFGCFVVMDIINKCLKLYDVNLQDISPCQLITRLEMVKPYYMARLSSDTIVVSRENKLLSVVRVSARRLEFLQDISCEFQYYGLAFVKENTIACTAYTDNKIDLVTISPAGFNILSLVHQYGGPELIACVPSTGSILYFEEIPGTTMNLVCISQSGERQFTVDLKSRPTDVWNMSAVEDKIICCNKQTNQLKLFSATGNWLSDLSYPEGTVNQPFAISFSSTGRLYIANDSTWNAEGGHFVTADINTFAFS